MPLLCGLNRIEALGILGYNRVRTSDWEVAVSTAGPKSPKSPRTGPFARDRLDSWKEIAAYLNRDVRTVQRWEETGGLPVYRHSEARVRGSAVYAYKSELEKWLRQSAPPSLKPERQPPPAAGAGWSPRRVAWVILLVLGLAAAGAALWRFARSSPSVPAPQAARLTDYPGLSHYPTFSPDGKKVAFSPKTPLKSRETSDTIGYAHPIWRWP